MQSAQLVLQKAETMPLHEGAQQVHLVGGVDLGAQLAGEVGLAGAVRQQRCVGQWRLGPDRLNVEHSGARCQGEPTQLPRRGVDFRGGDFKHRDEIVEKLDPAYRIDSSFERATGELIDVPSQHVWLVGRVDAGNLGCKLDVHQCQLYPPGQQLLVETVDKRLLGHSPKLS